MPGQTIIAGFFPHSGCRDAALFLIREGCSLCAAGCWLLAAPCTVYRVMTGRDPAERGRTFNPPREPAEKSQRRGPVIQREESRHDFAFMAGVIVGAISGALATLALTPMSGADTREKIRQTTSNVDLAPVKERVVTIRTTAATTAQSAVASGREKATELAAKAPLPLVRREDIGSGSDHVHTFGRREDGLTGTGSETAMRGGGTGSSGSTGGSEPRTGFGPHGGHTQEPSEGSPAVGQPGAGTSGSTQQSASPSGEPTTSSFGPHGAHTQEPAEGSSAIGLPGQPVSGTTEQDVVPDGEPRTGGQG